MKFGFRLLFLLLLTNVLTTKGQTKVKGNVKDANSNNLQNVTVSLIDKETKAIKSFSYTDKNGNFELDMPSSSPHLIRVSHVGFNVAEKELSPNGITYNFHLTAGNYSLNEIKVKAQNLIIQKGDTLNYNVKQFSNLQDRTIGDVIKNLPGITVSATGNISYNGKPINKLYIDGDDLLGEKYVLATTSIPNDAVETVQVLENHQPMKVLEDKVFSDNGALNIKLKESAKLKLFGSGNASFGLPLLRADVRANLLTFKSKLKAINSFGFNNLGNNLKNEVLTQNINNSTQMPSKDASEPLLEFTSLPDPLIPSKYYINNKTSLIAINNLLPLNKTESIRFNLYLLKGQVNNDAQNINNFYLPNTTITQFENQQAKQNKSNLFFSSNYLANSKSAYIQNQLSFETLLNKDFSALETERYSLNQNLNSKSYKITNSFSLIKENEKRLLYEGKSIIQYNRQPENLYINSGLYPSLVNNNIPYKGLEQFALQTTFSSNTSLSISKVYGRNTIGFKVEHLLETNNTNSALELSLNDDERLNAPDDFRNDFKWYNHKISMALVENYKSRKINFSLNLPLSSQHIQYRDFKSRIDSSLNRFIFEPQAKLNYEMGTYSKMSITARRDRNITATQDLLPGIIFNNYRYLSRNDQQLNFGSSNSISLAYGYRNTIKVTFLNLGVFLSNNYSPVIINNSFRLGFIEKQQQLFDNNIKRALFLLSFSKYIFPLKTTVKINLNSTLSNYNQLQNNVVNKLKNVSHNISGTVLFKPIWYFNTELNMSYLNSLTKNVTTDNFPLGRNTWMNTTFKTTVNLKENFYVQGELSHMHQQTTNSKNSFLLVDAKINYTLSKTKTDIGLQLINISNQRRLIINDFDGLKASMNSYWIRPLTLMLAGTYRF